MLCLYRSEMLCYSLTMRELTDTVYAFTHIYNLSIIIVYWPGCLWLMNVLTCIFERTVNKSCRFSVISPKLTIKMCTCRRTLEQIVSKILIIFTYRSVSFHQVLHFAWCCFASFICYSFASTEPDRCEL